MSDSAATSEQAKASDETEKDALKRTVAPAGWAIDLLEGLDAALCAAFEALLGDVEGGTLRLRAASGDAGSASVVHAIVLDSNGEAIAAPQAKAAIEAVAATRGLAVTELDATSIAITLEGTSAVASTPSPRSRRHRDS